MLISYMISYMILFMISYKKLWYHAQHQNLTFLVLLWYCQKGMMSYMISYMTSQFCCFSSLSCTIFVVILPTISYQIIWNPLKHQSWYGPLISVTSDIIAMWYHRFHDMLVYIMAPARRDGAGWVRQAPSAPPPLASPSPIAANVLGTGV